MKYNKLIISLILFILIFSNIAIVAGQNNTINNSTADYGIFENIFGGWGVINWGIFFIIICFIAYTRLPVAHASVFILISALLFMSFQKLPLWIMIIFSLIVSFLFFESTNPRTTSKETQVTMMTICLFIGLSSILAGIQLDTHDIEFITFPDFTGGAVTTVASSIAFIVELVVLPFTLFTSIAALHGIPPAMLLIASILLVPTAYILIIRVLNYIRGFG